MFGFDVITGPIKQVFRGGGTAEQYALSMAGLPTTGYRMQKELSKKQDKLLKKALGKMGLSQDEMWDVTTDLKGSQRNVIETALKRAAKFQDGGGSN